ncbi:PREDICTED: putative nuclease HARBI1 [Erythranthe guttata]|uniref:putative nuclease HARBI1 n=1 Tax=Erythranthe guttata TaxID=4155 RepID=UPI00064D9B9D|nr:PREDICTED: putative nuclease HARBI1 [Erythranthe guttata]|eukprot:XP_012842536.1 PREDICTED: putative nuclease HARBI1 [Erythranthe guttata]
MPRLNLSTKKLARRKKYIAMLSFWSSIMQLVHWFWHIALRYMENHTRSISLRPMYQYNFFEKRKYMQKIIYKSDRNCKKVTRMNRQTFVHLCSRLEATGIVSPTKNMLVDEQVAIAVHILAHHQKQIIIGVNFERSGETISRHFRKVINAIIRLQGELLKKPEPVQDDSTDQRWKWFKGCLGALDGTHIEVRVPLDDKPRYRTRKSQIATNVLGVCSQDMQFIYVLPGWEGSAADGRVLRDAISRTNGLVVPRGSYYLVDGGYTNCEGFLAPFRSQRYHLNDWSERHQPTTAEELFNMKHSSARNIIERLFGLLKSRWGILRSPSYYPIKIQNRIIMACCLLHNFIRREMGGYQLESDDDLEDGEGEEGMESENEDSEDEYDDEYINVIEPSNEWTTFRNNLAVNMFNTWTTHRNHT